MSHRAGGCTWVVRSVAVFVLGLLAMLAVTAPAAAAPKTWNEVVDAMSALLDQAADAYRAGDVQTAKDAVNEAYFGYYEKLGFEATVMNSISGQRGAAVEYQFAELLKDVNAGVPVDQLVTDLETLKSMLREDANILDGNEQQNPLAVFAQALLIMLREGFEAILVVGAVIAYLVKSGHSDKTRVVYAGAGLALLASAALAWLLNTITSLAGANQEVIEGVTILLAVAMLVYVSNWILSKSEADAFDRYIKRKSDESIARGSVFTLALVAFLAVFREGAELILFYQALLARAPGSADQLWIGMAVGSVLLVGVYLAIRFLSIRIPLRPFFRATSLLLALMAFSFVGSGIKELQEGGVIPVTSLPGVPTIDLLGIYPTVETLTAQAIVLVVLLILAWLGVRKGRRHQPPEAPGGIAAGPTTRPTEEAVGRALPHAPSQPENQESRP